MRRGDTIQLLPGAVPKMGQPLALVMALNPVNVRCSLHYDGRIVNVPYDQVRELPCTKETTWPGVPYC